MQTCCRRCRIAPYAQRCCRRRCWGSCWAASFRGCVARVARLGMPSYTSSRILYYALGLAPPAPRTPAAKAPRGEPGEVNGAWSWVRGWLRACLPPTYLPLAVPPRSSGCARHGRQRCSTSVTRSRNRDHIQGGKYELLRLLRATHLDGASMMRILPSEVCKQR